MTLVTVDAVVDIPRHVVVLEIIRVIAAMTSGALEDGVVVRIGVAGRAHIAGIAMAGREWRVLGVVKGGAAPGCGVVAVLAGCRKELRLCRVAGIRGVVVVRLVAPDAGRGQRRVVVVDVAHHASHGRCGMKSSKREGRVVVIKGRARPVRGAVAHVTSRREAHLRVHRIIRIVVVGLMA